MTRLSSTIAFALSVQAFVAAAAPVEPVKTPFAGARYDEAQRAVRFEPFAAVDWEKVARRNFRRFDIDHPPPKVVDDLRAHVWEGSGDAQVTFRAPLEPQVARGTYRLISAAGILPLEAAALDVSIGFHFEPPLPPKTIVRRGFWGEVVSQRIASGGGGGVVYWTLGNERPVRIEQAHAEIHQVGDRIVLSYADERSRASGEWAQPSAFTAFISSYGLSIAGQRYLFVAWPADTANIEAACLHRFSLYAVHEALEAVASVDYDCDP